MKKILSVFLTVCLGLFLVDAALSFLDDSLSLFWNIHAIGPLRGPVAFLSFPIGVLVYLLIGITPMIPKRYFLPIALFAPLTLLGSIPFFIYHLDHAPLISWVLSGLQVITAVCIVWALQRGSPWRWPVIREEQLTGKGFGWLNSTVFVLVNFCALAPAALIYLACCGSMAVSHFSGNFLALHTDSLAVQAREYVRKDGKRIHLIPMMHIGETQFYQQVLGSISTNSAVLLEGVSDEKNLLKQKLSYKRAASSLGLAEQHEAFEPTRGRPRVADVDVDQFSRKSIEFLKLATLLHTQPLTAQLLLDLFQQGQDPLLMNQLWDDLLDKRNQHLLKEIEVELRRSDTIIVPWGAAHMRGLAEGIQKSGFQPVSAQEYKILHFSTILKKLASGKP